MKTIKFHHPSLEYTDENNGSGFITVPGQYIACPECGGEGYHVRRDMDDSALIDSMMEDGDYEGIEGYYRGDYDTICETCNGNRVILEPFWDEMPKWARTAINEWNESERESRRIYEAESRMGA